MMTLNIAPKCCRAKPLFSLAHHADHDAYGLFFPCVRRNISIILRLHSGGQMEMNILEQISFNKPATQLKMKLKSFLLMQG